MSDRWEGLRRGFRAPPRGRGVRGEVKDELSFHLEERIEELVGQGLSREAAEREARERFGDLRKLKAQIERIDLRSARKRARGEARNAVLRDLRFGFRGLRRHPGFSLAAILTLGIGLGATGSIYTLLQRVVLDPLPFPAADR